MDLDLEQLMLGADGALGTPLGPPCVGAALLPLGAPPPAHAPPPLPPPGAGAGGGHLTPPPAKRRRSLGERAQEAAAAAAAAGLEALAQSPSPAGVLPAAPAGSPSPTMHTRAKARPNPRRSVRSLRVRLRRGVLWQQRRRNVRCSLDALCVGFALVDASCVSGVLPARPAARHARGSCRAGSSDRAGRRAVQLR
jgi:hypothetical protein